MAAAIVQSSPGLSAAHSDPPFRSIVEALVRRLHRERLVDHLKLDPRCTMRLTQVEFLRVPSRPPDCAVRRWSRPSRSRLPAQNYIETVVPRRGRGQLKLLVKDLVCEHRPVSGALFAYGTRTTSASRFRSGDTVAW